MEISAKLGHEGREGKAAGTTFVIGDTEKVLPLTSQMILNPFRGYHEKDRNILNPELEETIKELSAIDGAFIVRGNGVIESAGTFLKSAGLERKCFHKEIIL